MWKFQTSLYRHVILYMIFYKEVIVYVKPGLHEQIKQPALAHILDLYETTLSEIVQIKVTLFAHVNKALRTLYLSKKGTLYLSNF